MEEEDEEDEEDGGLVGPRGFSCFFVVVPNLVSLGGGSFLSSRLTPFFFFSTTLVVAYATHLKIENVEVGGRVNQIDERLGQLLVLVEVRELGWDTVFVVGMGLLQLSQHYTFL